MDDQYVCDQKREEEISLTSQYSLFIKLFLHLDITYRDEFYEDSHFSYSFLKIWLFLLQTLRMKNSPQQIINIKITRPKDVPKQFAKLGT